MKARALLAALLLCLAQVGIVLATAPGHGYLRLLNWDSFHYVDIAANGYHVVPNPTSADVHGGRANAVFFPGYPWAARALSDATGLSIQVSLLIVAQAACVLFWLYFLELLGGWSELRRGRGAAAAAAVFVFPAAFFLVTGYTESLFLAAALGFVFWGRRWMGRPGPLGAGLWVLAALHGYVMCLTRVVGIGVALFPVLALFCMPPSGRKRATLFQAAAAVGLFLASIAGAITFFAYCRSQLGDWRIYFKLEEIGWGNITYAAALLDPRSYVPHYFFEPTEDSISRTAVPFIAAIFAYLGIGEWKAKLAGARTRLPLYLVAFFMFQIAVAAKANAKMDSMIRYSLPVFALLMICWAGYSRERAMGPLQGPRRAAVAFGFALSLATQLWLAYRFTHGHWAA